MKHAIVTGAGGFIGAHLVERLKAEGYWVCGIDLKHPEFAPSAADEFRIADLRSEEETERALRSPTHDPIDEIYLLAADMGGMGFIGSHHADVLANNLAINVNAIRHIRLCARLRSARVFFASSACVYPEYAQEALNVRLAEEDAYPAAPDLAYGWEKLVIEQLLTHARTDWGLDVRIARFHNIYGERGAWHGGREKAPAALCRKVAVARLTSTPIIDIWGDGKQTRTFCYIDDCIEGVRRLMQSDYTEPLNIGSPELISINDLAYLIARLAGLSAVGLRYVDGAQGVRGRAPDNTRILAVLGWQPSMSLADGMRRTYQWVAQQVLADDARRWLDERVQYEVVHYDSTGD
jgi:GDP-D-mannose 3', 5'-epimerase